MIGGGPSLAGYDFAQLRGRTVVAINDAVLSLPWANVLFSLDLTWIARRMPEIAAFRGEVHLAVSDDFDSSGLPARVHLWRRIRDIKGLSRVDGFLGMGGGNSGFGAFNLAVLKGAKRIVLLGYDLCHSGSHWHNGYVWQGGKNDAMYRHWAQQYIYTVRDLETARVEVFNASKDSMISVFPKIPLGTLPLPPINT